MNTKTKEELLAELLEIDPGFIMNLRSRSGGDHPHLGILKPEQKVTLAARHIELDKFVVNVGWRNALATAIRQAKQNKKLLKK